MTLFLTEQQRTEALGICERIEALNEKMQGHAKAALEILERMSAPKTAAPAPLVIYVHDLISGRVIASRTVADTNPYSGEWITEAIATWFECTADDVGCIETDDGERYTVRGEIVASVEVN